MKRSQDNVGNGDGGEPFIPSPPMTKFLKADTSPTLTSTETENNNHPKPKLSYVVWKETKKANTSTDDPLYTGPSTSGLGIQHQPPSSSEYDYENVSPAGSKLSLDPLSTPKKPRKPKPPSPYKGDKFIDLEEDEMWFQFLHFSLIKQHRTNSKTLILEKEIFNPFDASIADVLDFFQYLMVLHDCEIAESRLTRYLDTFRQYVPSLRSLVNISREVLVQSKPRFMVDKLFRPQLPRLCIVPLNKANSYLFQHFRSYCFAKDLDMFASKYEKLSVYLLFIFRQIRDGKVDIDDFRRNSYKFYTTICDNLAQMLDGFHKEVFVNQVYMSQDEFFLNVRKIAGAMDDNLISHDDAINYYPPYHYGRIRVKQEDENGFWNSEILKKVLKDIQDESLPIQMAARELGVTQEMLHHAIMDGDRVPDGETQSLAQFMTGGRRYSTEDRYWSSGDMVELLEDVRNRRKTVAEVAAIAGVSRTRVLERAGHIRTHEEIEKEEQEAKIRKINEKQEKEANRPKKPTQLERQIMMSEENEEDLCAYEKHRLGNLRERQALMDSLNMDQDKRELKRLRQVERVRTPQAKEPIVLRERSARIQKRQELERLNGTPRQLFNHAPSRLVGPVSGLQIKLPRDYHGKRLVNEDILLNTPLPKFDLLPAQLLEITTDYRKSSVFLDSVYEECKEINRQKKEPALQTGFDWSQWIFKDEKIVSSSPITSIDSYHDLVCYGTEAGGVGVLLAGRSITLRPHNEEVTSVSMSGVQIMSGSKDGTARLTDLAKDAVLLEYSWDHDGGGKVGVRSVQRLNTTNFLIDCGHSIRVCDTRAQTNNVITDLSSSGGSHAHISLEPSREKHFSVVRNNVVSIYDVRKAADPLLKKKWSDQVDNASWSAGGKYFAIEAGNFDTTILSSSEDGDSPVLCKPGSMFTVSQVKNLGKQILGVFPWVSWNQPLLLSSMRKRSHGETDIKLAVASVLDRKDVNSLEVVLSYSKIALHTHRTRPLIVMGNVSDPGRITLLSCEPALVKAP